MANFVVSLQTKAEDCNSSIQRYIFRNSQQWRLAAEEEQV